MDLQVDGRRAFAYTGGKAFDAALPCVVFLHGALHDHSVWTLLARWCAHHGHAVLALDLPGHGRSAGPALGSVSALAAWALRTLDAAGVERAAWVGHSMGSLIALEAAAQAPPRASRLVMVGTAYPMKVSPALLEAARDTPYAAIDRVNAFSHAGHGAKPSYPGPGTWLHGANRALMRRTFDAYARAHAGDNLFVTDFTACDAYDGAEAAAARVACPVHGIVGERDQMTPPRAARDLAQALKATVSTVPCGHALMQEAPDAVLRALQRALA